MNIRLPKKVSNQKVKVLTQLKPWSQTIKIPPIKWFGHLIRLPNNTPSKTPLKYLNEKTKRPQGQQRATCPKMMKSKQLQFELKISNRNG